MLSTPHSKLVGLVTSLFSEGSRKTHEAQDFRGSVALSETSLVVHAACSIHSQAVELATARDIAFAYILLSSLKGEVKLGIGHEPRQRKAEFD
jgi:hypothetical protein